MIGPLATAVFAVAHAVFCAAGVLSAAMPASGGPLWPAARFLCAAFLHGQVKKFLQLIVLLARWRVILCLANRNELLGWMFYPFVFVARKLLHWNESSWLLGCACGRGGRLSLLSWIPVSAADATVAALALVQQVPVFGRFLGPIAEFGEAIHPVLSFIFDLIFSIGVAEGLAMVVEYADENTHSKLVWMSMIVSRMLREGPEALSSPSSINRSSTSSRDDIAARQAATVTTAPITAPGATAPHPSPLRWSEDGNWSLFD